MTDKIIEAARLAGVSITVHSGKPGGPWAESHFVTPNLERFYALAYRQALEDAAKAVKSLTAEIRFQAIEHYKFADAAEKTILALKEQQSV